MTRDGVGEGVAGEDDSMDGIASSWLGFEEDPDVDRAALAAPARVVTMFSPRESFENCSTDMKVV
jgi:hypothetical protein